MPTAPEEAPLSRDELLAQFTAALRAEGYTGEVRLDVEKGTVELPGTGSTSFDRLYAALATGTEKRRHELLSKTARFLLHPPTLPTRWDDARDSILPFVKRRIDLVADELHRQMGAGPPVIGYSLITEHEAFHLTVPHEMGQLTVPAERLTEWKVEGVEAFRTAARNLEARSREEWRPGKDSSGVYVSPWRDGYDAARLFLPRQFGRVPMQGRPVVIAPQPSLLLVTGSEQEEGLFNLARLARRIIDHEKTFFFLRALRMNEDGESWDDWMPPKEHPAHDPLRLLRALDERRDYDDHAALVREFAKGKAHMPVPRLSIIQSAIGAETLTATVWKAGKPTALPKADVIILQRDEEVLGFAPWGGFTAALPSELKALPGYPTRHLAADFPDPWQVDAIELEPWRRPLPA